MQRSKFVKTVTLASFVSWIILFLFYRSGKLDGYLPGSNSPADASVNANTIIAPKPDSVPVKLDSTPMSLISSSKSIIIIRPAKNKKNDSTKKKIPDSLKLKLSPSSQQLDSEYFLIHPPAKKIDTSSFFRNKKKKNKQ